MVHIKVHLVVVKCAKVMLLTLRSETIVLGMIDAE